MSGRERLISLMDNYAEKITIYLCDTTQKAINESGSVTNKLGKHVKEYTCNIPPNFVFNIHCFDGDTEIDEHLLALYAHYLLGQLWLVKKDITNGTSQGIATNINRKFVALHDWEGTNELVHIASPNQHTSVTNVLPESSKSPPTQTNSVNPKPPQHMESPTSFPKKVWGIVNEGFDKFKKIISPSPSPSPSPRSSENGSPPK
jgi:hypothetical protein